jgi:uncharacterized membrane protein YagU involved in acid resistance
MSSQTATAKIEQYEQGAWLGGAVAGIAGGVLMGIMLTTQMTPVIERAIPAMYGLTGLTAGWVVHLFHSAVLGLVFAGVVRAAPQYVGTRVKCIGAGVAYGVVLWIVLAAIVMPIWLGAVNFPGTPPLPNFNPMSLVGHVVYGAVLGAVFPSVAELGSGQQTGTEATEAR